MARVILLSDFGVHRAGSVLDEKYDDPVAELRAAGAPLVPYSESLGSLVQALLAANRQSQPWTKQDLLTLLVLEDAGVLGGVSSQFPAADGDGVVHLYTDVLLGDDGALGTADEPLLTWQAAFDRYAEWLRLDLPLDFHVHLGAGTVVESVVVRQPLPPRGRLRVTGDTSSMTVLAEGTIDSVALEPDLLFDVVEDASATFGTARELAGYPVRVWDPNEADEPDDAPLSASWLTVGEHDGTHLTLTGSTSYFAQAEAGWRYRVLRPSTRIDSTSLALPSLVFDGQRRNSFNISDTGYYRMLDRGGGGSLFEWVEFVRNDQYDKPNTLWKNADVWISGCVFSGVCAAATFDGCNVGTTGPIAERDLASDAFLGLPLGDGDYSRFACVPGVRRVFGGVGALYFKHSSMLGGFVAIGTHTLSLDDSYAVVSNAVVHAGNVELFYGSQLRLFYSKIVDTPANHAALELNDNPIFGGGYVEVLGPVVIDGALADAITAGARTRVVIHDDSEIITGPGGIAGRGIVARWGAQVSVGQNTTGRFTCTGNEIEVDGQVGTFVGLTEGNAVERAGYSGARVYRAEVWS